VTQSENTHRAKIINALEFQSESLHVKTIAEGVEAFMGKLKGKGDSIVQSYEFDGIKFTAEQAKKWLRKNDIRIVAFLEAEVENKGGEGSGNFGHAGRPGEIGGSSDDGGTGVALMHGTSSTNIASIKKNGILQNKSGESQGWVADQSDRAVYLAKDRATAEYWAEAAAENREGTAVIVKVVIPDSYSNLLSSDPDTQNIGIRFKGDILPDWIVDIERLTGKKK
jgi:hypothetical protein